MGLRTTGHFNPKKSYYNTDIQAVDYSLDKAKELLAADAWEDSNNDGTLDKDINGSRTELELELLITGSSLSQNIALLFQESAKQAGVKVNIVNKQMSLIRKENLSNFNFDMAALAATADANPDDPYSRWHSDNAVPGKQNQIGYSNSEADALIEEIRTTRDVEKRADAYRELQEIMHEDQPCIFLYSPMQKIIISKRLDAVTSSKRPGYSANSFKLAE